MFKIIALRDMSQISTTSFPSGLSETSKQQLRLTSMYEESWQDKAAIYVEGHRLGLKALEELTQVAEELRFSCKTFLINEEVLLIKGEGFLSEKEWQGWWQQLSDWCRTRQKRSKALILDLSEVRWITYRTRQQMEASILRNPANWARIYFVLSDLLKTIYQIQQRNHPKDYAFVDLCTNIPTALRYIYATPEHTPAPYDVSSSIPRNPASLKEIDNYTKEELYAKLQNAMLDPSVLKESFEVEAGPFLPAKPDHEKHDPESGRMADSDNFEDLMQATRVLQSDIMAVVRRFNTLNHSLEKQVENRTREIAEKESNLSAVIENTTDMILSLNRELKVLVINSKAQDQINRRFGVMLHRGDLLPEKFMQTEMEKWYPFLIEALGGERMRRHYSEKDLETGNMNYFEFSLNPILNEKQQITGVSIFCKDETETHLYQREIEAKEQMLSSINYSIKEGIFRTVPNKGIVYINKAFVDMFGYDSEQEMKQIDIDSIYVDSNRRYDFIEIMKDNDYFVNEEVQFRRKDGSTFWGLISSIKTIAEDGAVYQDGAVRDITEVKETRAELMRRNEELTKVNKELDSFVYRTSHDLRAPLVSVKGLVDVMELAKDEQERLKYMNLMRRSIDKLDGFIRDIIGYSRNSRSLLKREAIDLEAMIEDTFESLYYLDNSDRIQKTVNIQGDATLFSDPTRLGIIFINLISNAIQYCDLTKEQSQVSIDVDLTPEGARIAVADNGIGIQAQHLGKIFEMFYRGTQFGQGSGIGLYIVHETVEKLQGTITAASQEGEGARFDLWIPQIAAPQILNLKT